MSTSAAWFHGHISREESMQRLLAFPDGGFLVRHSSKPHCFSLDIVTAGGNFLPLLVKQAPQQGEHAVELVASPESALRGGTFPSLAAMVEANQHVLTMPCAAPASASVAAGVLPRPVHVELAEENAELKTEAFDTFQRVAARGFAQGPGKLRREGSEEGEMLMASGGLGGGGKSKREGDEECQFLMSSEDMNMNI